MPAPRRRRRASIGPGQGAHLSRRCDPHLNILEGAWHHGNKHVYEDDAGHGVVHHEQVFAYVFGEFLHGTTPDRGELGEPEKGPEQGGDTVIQAETANHIHCYNRYLTSSLLSLTLVLLSYLI